MPRIYKISRAGLRLIYKIRHHRGHGIHSPFVFNLINKVIEEKSPYYAYQDIRDYVNLKRDRHMKPRKVGRLLFKLVNYFEAEKILEIGSGEGLNTLYLTAPSSSIVCHSIELNPVKSATAKELYVGWDRKIVVHTEAFSANLVTEKQDCIYINLKNYKHLNAGELEMISKLVHPKTFIIVEGIRTNKRHRALWNCIKEAAGRTTVLDLFNIGIVFFDAGLYPWEYKISF